MSESESEGGGHGGNWYYGQDGQQKGPVDLDTLRGMYARGELRPTDLVWREGMADWAPASSVADLGPAPQQGYPPPPPQGYGQAPYPGQHPGQYPPQQGGYPGQPIGYYADPQAAALEKKATTAMVLGIVSLVGVLCCACVGIGCGIAAIVVGRGAAGAPTGAGKARAGVVMGTIGVILSILAMIINIYFLSRGQGFGQNFGGGF